MPDPPVMSRVGTRRDDLKRLGGHGRIGARVSLVGDNLNSRPLDILHDGVVDEIARKSR